MLQVNRVVLTGNELDELVHVGFEDAKVRHLGPDKAGSDQGSLMGPDLVVGGEDTSAEQRRRTLPPQRAHAKVLKLVGEHSLNQLGVAGVDRGPQVGVRGEGLALLRVALLQQGKEAELLGGGQVLKDDIGAEYGVLLRQLLGRQGAVLPLHAVAENVRGDDDV